MNRMAFRSPVIPNHHLLVVVGVLVVVGILVHVDGAAAAPSSSTTSRLGDKLIAPPASYNHQDGTFVIPVHHKVIGGGLEGTVWKGTISGTDRNVKFSTAEGNLPREFLLALISAARSKGLYSLEIPSSCSDLSLPPIQSSIDACTFITQNFEDLLRIRMEGDRIIAVDHAVAKVSCNSATVDELERSLSASSSTTSTTTTTTISTRVAIMKEVTGPRPFFDPMIYSTVVSSDGNPTGAAAAPQQERSFFQKYWMYMIPAALILMNLMNGLVQAPENGAAGAAAGGRGSGRS